VFLFIDLGEVDHDDASCKVEQFLDQLFILLLSDICDRPSHVFTPKPVNPIHLHEHVSLGIWAKALILIEHPFSEIANPFDLRVVGFGVQDIAKRPIIEKGTRVIWQK
jgi:hypothetical protein